MNDYLFILALLGCIVVTILLIPLFSRRKTKVTHKARQTKSDGSIDYEKHNWDCRIINGVHIPNCVGTPDEAYTGTAHLYKFSDEVGNRKNLQGNPYRGIQLSYRNIVGRIWRGAIWGW